jgi:hypothetical protein
VPAAAFEIPSPASASLFVYTRLYQLGLPDPRKLPCTPSADAATTA